MKLANITESFDIATSIVVINNSSVFKFEKGDDKFESILLSLKDICTNSHEMPAFSVALDGETKTAKASGLWIELKFPKQLSHNEMPFDSLLIEVNSDYSGFNLIRGNNGIYEGRCFYLNLQDNMSDLDNTIKNIIA